VLSNPNRWSLDHLLTFSHSVSNLGGTFPRFFILKFVDAFTVATCQPPTTSPKLDTLKGDLITQAFSCVAEAEKHRCVDGGGVCKISQDGMLELPCLKQLPC